MILSRLIAFLVLCCPFTFALGQTAEFDQFDSMSNRIRVAQEYVRIHPIEDTMRDMLSSLADNADLSPVEKEEFVDLMMGMYDMQPIEEDMILIMSRHFTFYELSALRDFYASEEGHAVMQKYPAMMAEMIPTLQRHIMSALDKELGDGAGDQWSALSMSVQEVIPGTWDWEGESSCTGWQHTIQLTDDGEELVLTYDQDDGNVLRTVRYEILGAGQNYLRMHMEGEDRTNDDGRLVDWDLVVVDEDTLCWRRDDWGQDACTEPLVRCVNY